MVVKKLAPLKIEVVRLYHRVRLERLPKTGTRCTSLPPGLKQAEKLPEPIFTPATRPHREHDENISFAKREDRRRPSAAERVRDTAIRIYLEAADYAAKRGIIIADTKFEFGTDGKGALILIDEVLTPDSSRFWPASGIADQSAVVRQAVRARLAGNPALEQEGACAAAPARSWQRLRKIPQRGAAPADCLNGF
jgi:phosphoribosylaminoimidazole-succinocarboxamide synthase